MTVRDYVVLGSAVGIAFAMETVAENALGLHGRGVLLATLLSQTGLGLIRLLFLGIVLVLFRGSSE